MAWRAFGQGQAVELLDKGLRDGRLSHAYLLVGPPQVGKLTLALQMAQAVNCAGERPPCLECRSCRRIRLGLHPDVRVMSLGMAEAGRNYRQRVEIGVDDIKELQGAASLPPYEGKTRVFVLDGADRLSAEAANRLLKTLEEPPPNVLFLLLSARERLVLPTVASRCQRVELRPMPLTEVCEVLVRHFAASASQADLLARLSRGRLGWAVSALGDGTLLEQRRDALSTLAGVPRRNYNERFALAAEWARTFERSREDVEGLLDLWLGWWRDVALVVAGCAEDVTNIDMKNELAAAAGEFSMAEAHRALTAVRDAGQHLSANVNARLALEVLMLSLPGKGARS